MDCCCDVHAYADENYCITAWRPTMQELIRLNLGEPLYLGIAMSGNMPPVFLTVDNPFTKEEADV
jgi:hypothetical protein